jgi:serine protease Do
LNPDAFGLRLAWDSWGILKMAIHPAFKRLIQIFGILIVFFIEIPHYSTAAETADPNVFVILSKKAVPSVVNISTTILVKSPYIQGSPDDLFRKFFEDFMGPEGEDGIPRPKRQIPSQQQPKAISLGTGFIIDSTGLILTNNHVVSDADEIKITFTEAPDERPTEGEVVGRDVEMDVALIKVKSKREMIPMQLGDSEALQVGEYVAAVGNPFGQGHSVTHGIISAKGRLSPTFPLGTYIQTDAPINPGNSGGPLLNLKGEVIGINNAIDARAQGIGFAIPINEVKRTLPQLKTKGTVDRGYIGILVGELNPALAEKLNAPKDIQAPFVTGVTPNSPAAKAGIQPYDIILEVNGKAMHVASELVQAVTAVSIGDTAKIKLSRNGKNLDIPVKVTQRPSLGAQTQPKQKKEEKKKAPVEMGMEVETLTPGLAKRLELPENTTGVIVTAIAPNGPADQVGLSRGDIIVEADRKPIKNVDSLYSIVKDKKSYLLRVRKNIPGSPQEVFSVVVLDLAQKQ